jgi:erythromycin esterase-like protein
MASDNDSTQSQTDQLAEIERLAEQVWPEEEDVDKFLAWLREWRQARRQGLP